MSDTQSSDNESTDTSLASPSPRIRNSFREDSSGIKIFEPEEDEVLCFNHTRLTVKQYQLSETSLKLADKIKKKTSVEDIPIKTITLLEHERLVNEKRGVVFDRYRLFRSVSSNYAKRCEICYVDRVQSLGSASTSRATSMAGDNSWGTCAERIVRPNLVLKPTERELGVEHVKQFNPLYGKELEGETPNVVLRDQKEIELSYYAKWEMERILKRTDEFPNAPGINSRLTIMSPKCNPAPGIYSHPSGLYPAPMTLIKDQQHLLTRSDSPREKKVVEHQSAASGSTTPRHNQTKFNESDDMNPQIQKMPCTKNDLKSQVQNKEMQNEPSGPDRNVKKAPLKSHQVTFHKDITDPYKNITPEALLILHQARAKLAKQFPDMDNIPNCQNDYNVPLMVGNCKLDKKMDIHSQMRQLIRAHNNNYIDQNGEPILKTVLIQASRIPNYDPSCRYYLIGGTLVTQKIIKPNKPTNAQAQNKNKPQCNIAKNETCQKTQNHERVPKLNYMQQYPVYINPETKLNVNVPVNYPYYELPNQNNYGVLPNQTNYGILPNETNYGVDPNQNNYGVDPNQNNYGVFSNQNNYGVDPNQNNYGMFPTQNNYGMFPNQNNYGVDPKQNMNGVYPNQNINGGFPNQNMNAVFPNQNMNGVFPNQNINGVFPNQNNQEPKANIREKNY